MQDSLEALFLQELTEGMEALKAEHLHELQLCKDQLSTAVRFLSQDAVFSCNRYAGDHGFCCATPSPNLSAHPQATACRRMFKPSLGRK